MAAPASVQRALCAHGQTSVCALVQSPCPTLVYLRDRSSSKKVLVSTVKRSMRPSCTVHHHNHTVKHTRVLQVLCLAAAPATGALGTCRLGSCSVLQH